MKSLLTNPKWQAAGLLLVLLTMTANLAWARSATPPPAGHRNYDLKRLSINRWACPFNNDGRYGLDTIGTGYAGGLWPQPLKNGYIFGAGLWFGSIRVQAEDPSKEDTLVTFGYNPNSGGTEMSPVTVENAAEGTGSPEDRIFVYPGDWPPAPRDRWVKSNDLDTIVPRDNFSLQDMWCAYSDVLAENHISPGKPQNIDVFETVYAWNYPSNQDIFFITYVVRNASTTDTLKSCYMGAVCDPDVGSSGDDMVGTLLNTYVPGADTVKNVGYVGDNDNHEVPGTTYPWESGTPGVFAYKFLESPKDTSGRSLGMTAFKKFTIDIDPVTDAAQYLTMAGYDYRTSVYSPYDSALDIAAADKRFVQCSGPFTLAPQQMVRLVIACIGAPFGGADQKWANRPIDSLVHLARVANQAQFIYDQGWLLPGPPLAPNTTLVPGDNQVRIVWDDLPEKSADPYWQKVASDPAKQGWDPKYRGYDFQGYVVYKSKNGSDWEILAQCDLADSITFNYPPGGDSAGIPDSLWLKATDAGVFYNVVDSSVTNGFTYYYCVAAYDWNYQTTMWLSTPQGRTPLAWDTLIFRSGLVANFSTVPRWDAPNYVMPTTDVVTAVGDSTSPGMKWRAEVVVPAQVTADTYAVRFLGPVYGGGATKSTYRYVVTVPVNEPVRHDSVVIDTTSFGYTIGNTLTRALPVFNGLALSCTLHIATPTKALDSAYVIRSAQYPAESVNAKAGSVAKAWAYRGSDYMIVWTNEPGYMTAKVYDATHPGSEVVPPTRWPWTATSMPDTAANGWCFLQRGFKYPSDTLTGRVASIYICGGYVQFRPSGDSVSSLVSAIQSGDTWYAVGHKSEGTAPYYNVYQLLSKPGVSRVDTTHKLNVKVVPNPYVVFNAWEKSTDQRYVRFTHLPSDCTIRIYTVAGDLVKVIKHTDSKHQQLDQAGTETWDFTNESPGSTGTAISGQLVASGVYVYHVESKVGEAVGKLAFIY